MSNNLTGNNMGSGGVSNNSNSRNSGNSNNSRGSGGNYREGGSKGGNRNRAFIRNSIIIWSIVLVMAAGALIAASIKGGAGFGDMNIWPFHFGFVLSADRSEFTEIKSETINEKITSLSLNWISGEVSILESNSNEARIIQKGMADFPEDELFSAKVSGGKLVITDGRRNKVSFGFNFGKTSKETDIYVYLPAKVYDSVKADCVSSSIRTSVLKAAELDLHTVSGDMDFTGDFTDIYISTVSGSIRSSGSSAREARFKTTSGSIKAAGSFRALDIDTVSGDVRVESDAMLDEMKANSVSGSIYIAIPDNNGFSIDFSKVSGSIRSDFAFKINGSRYTYKDGGPVFKAGTVSGDVEIAKK